MKLELTRFQSLRDPKGSRETIDCFDFGRSLTVPRVGEKSSAPLWSFATFKGDHRKNENVESISAFGIDVDELPPANADDRLQGVGPLYEAVKDYLAFIYSTPSHTLAAPRFRAIVPFSRPVSREEYTILAPAFLEVLREEGIRVDGACKDPARAWFVPTIVNESAPYRSLGTNAEKPIDVEEALKNIRPMYETARVVRPITSHGGDAFERCRRYVAKMEPAISGSGGHGATFRAACAIVQRFGLRGAEAWSVICEYNDRCQPRWSERELRHKLAQAEKTARAM